MIEWASLQTLNKMTSVFIDKTIECQYLAKKTVLLNCSMMKNFWPTLKVLANDLRITTSNVCNTMPHKRAWRSNGRLADKCRVCNECKKHWNTYIRVTQHGIQMQSNAGTTLNLLLQQYNAIGKYDVTALQTYDSQLLPPSDHYVQDTYPKQNEYGTSYMYVQLYIMVGLLHNLCTMSYAFNGSNNVRLHLQDKWVPSSSWGSQKPQIKDANFVM